MVARSSRGFALAVTRSLGGSPRKSSLETSLVALFNFHGGLKPRFASSSTMPSQSPESPSSIRTTQKEDLKMADRLSAVIDAANDRKLPPELRGQRNAIREYGNLWRKGSLKTYQPGKGKPLNLSSNPHANPAENTLYRVLSKNRCAPEWVELNKEIRGTIAEWRSALQTAWSHKHNENDAEWIECSEALKVKLRGINDKVFRYNLIVPFGR